MNQKLLILFCTFFFKICLYSQDIKGKIINSQTKVPLPFSTIITKNDNLSGEYANENGEFIIKQKLEKDTLLISCIGYLNKEISIIEYLQSKNKIIELTPSVNLLPTIIAKNTRLDPKEIGFSK